MEPRIMALEAKVRHLRFPMCPEAEAASSPENPAHIVVPHWDCVRLGDGVVLSGDWDPDFFDNTTRTDRVLTSWATARGELYVSQWEHHTPFRARISFKAKSAFSVRASILTENTLGVGWQLNVNGVITPHAGPLYPTLNFNAGVNTLTISKGATGSERIHFDAILFDGKNSVWVPQ